MEKNIKTFIVLQGTLKGAKIIKTHCLLKFTLKKNGIYYNID